MTITNDLRSSSLSLSQQQLIQPLLTVGESTLPAKGLLVLDDNADEQSSAASNNNGILSSIAIIMIRPKFLLIGFVVGSFLQHLAITKSVYDATTSTDTTADGGAESSSFDWWWSQLEDGGTSSYNWRVFVSYEVSYLFVDCFFFLYLAILLHKVATGRLWGGPTTTTTLSLNLAVNAANFTVAFLSGVVMHNARTILVVVPSSSSSLDIIYNVLGGCVVGVSICFLTRWAVVEIEELYSLCCRGTTPHSSATEEDDDQDKPEMTHQSSYIVHIV